MMWMRTKNKALPNCGNVRQNETVSDAHETISPVNAGDGCDLVGLLLPCDARRVRLKPEMNALGMTAKWRSGLLCESGQSPPSEQRQRRKRGRWAVVVDL